MMDLSSNLTGLDVKVPRLIWAWSSVSFTLLSIKILENLMISRCLRLTLFFSWESSNSVKFMVVLNGVRISCDTLAL
jgi:hypothetical protein